MIVDTSESKAVSHPDGEPGWMLADPLAAVGSMRSFVSDDKTGDRIRVRYFKRAHDGALVAKVWFGPGAEGPPGHAHGGSIAAVLDEAMGAAAWMIGHSVVIVRLDVTFRRAVPLGTDATVEMRITRKRGKKIWICGQILGPDETVFAEARGLFIDLDMGRFTEDSKRNIDMQRPGLI